MLLKHKREWIANREPVLIGIDGFELSELKIDGCPNARMSQRQGRI